MSHVGEQPSFEMCHCPHEVSTPPASVEHGERAAIRRADDARRRGAVLAEVRQHPLLCLEQRPFLARVRDLEDESATAICAIDDEILIAFAGELSRAALPAITVAGDPRGVIYGKGWTVLQHSVLSHPERSEGSSIPHS